MRRNIDVNQIKEIAANLEKLTKDLADAKNKLYYDIYLLENAYTGHDANIIREKYLQRIDTLNKVITNYFEYITYIKKVSGIYDDNIKNVRKNLMSLIKTPSDEAVEDYKLSFDTAFTVSEGE